MAFNCIYGPRNCGVWWALADLGWDSNSSWLEIGQARLGPAGITAAFHVTPCCPGPVFLMAMAKEWERRIGAGTLSLLPCSLGHSGQRLNPGSRSTLCLLMAKGADTRNDIASWSLTPCVTLAERCCFPSFIGRQNLPPGTTTAPRHGRAHRGGARLMSGPKLSGGGEENAVLPSLL